ncbi:MAG TPA: phospholipase [Firmicutes bacterium]|nr:phospholipase [Bacillota bacterium]
MIRILSIDGGGIRGIVPATILVSFEAYLKEYSGNRDAKIGDYFDLIAGTSTGSILTGIYLCPDKLGSINPKYSAQDALDLYMTEGKKIFNQTFLNTIKSGFGLYGPKYSPKPLEKLLLQYFDDYQLSDMIKPCLIPAYDIGVSEGLFFNQIDYLKDDNRNLYVRDVIRGSTAAPTYFPPANFKGEKGNEFTLIDGGVLANNPSLCAYIEACKYLRCTNSEDVMLLSIGTGTKQADYSYQLTKGWGGAQWSFGLLNILFSAASETVDHQLKILYQGVPWENQYTRVEVNLKEVGINTALDDTSDQNMLDLLKLGDSLTKEYEVQLRDFAKQAVKEQLKRERVKKGNNIK